MSNANGTSINGTSNGASSGTASLFGYDPNFPFAIVAVALFTFTAGLHIFQYIKNKTWFFYMMMIGIFMEMIGYWARAISVKNKNSQGASMIWYFFIMLGPSFLAAGCYMTFGRIIYWVTPESRRGFRHLWIPARFMALLFLFWDMVAFLVQVLALLIVFSNVYKTNQDPARMEKQVDMAYNILRVGFVMQICVFGIFALLALRFMFVSKQWRYDWPEGGSHDWRRMAWVITGASILIAIRALYRTLEFTINQGKNYIASHEWCFYVFDSLLLLLVLIAFNCVHPGSYMPHEYCTIRHQFKKPGFRRDPTVKLGQETSAGYSRVAAIPPPLAVPAMASMTSHPPAGFSDPWANRINTPNEI